MEETAEVLSDPDALSALEAGLAEIERGETVTLADLRAELAERRPTAVRPRHKDETGDALHLAPLRQRIESIYCTAKDILTLERHLGGQGCLIRALPCRRPRDVPGLAPHYLRLARYLMSPESLREEIADDRKCRLHP